MRVQPRSAILAVALAAQTALPVAAETSRTSHEISWKVAPQTMVEYQATCEAGEGESRRLVRFGAELAEKAPRTTGIDRIEEVGDALVLALPGRLVRLGARWRIRFVFEQVTEHQPFQVGGTYTLIEETEVDGKRYLRIEGRFEGRSGSGRSEERRILAGRWTSSALFDPIRGRVVEGFVDYQIEVQTRGGREMVEGENEYHLEKDLHLSPAQLGPAIGLSVQRGVEWLKAQQEDDGSFRSSSHAGSYPMGATAMNLLALLKSGVRRLDPAIESGFTYLRSLPYEKTYSVSLLIMAIEARHAGEPTARIETGREGVIRFRLPADDLAWMKEATDWLIRSQSAPGVWGYGSEKGGYDHSNLQYAALALKAASRCGLPIDLDIWRAMVDHFVRAQEPNGPATPLERVLDVGSKGRTRADVRQSVRSVEARGWGYTAGDEGYGSMTAAGIGCLVLAQSALIESGKLDRRTRDRIQGAMRDGLAWLSRHYSVVDNPGRGDSWFTYYLYGLERAMVLSRTRTLGGRDWYHQGASQLLRLQDESGAWSGSASDTAFALLFLKRATTPVVILTGTGR